MTHIVKATKRSVIISLLLLLIITTSILCSCETLAEKQLEGELKTYLESVQTGNGEKFYDMFYPGVTSKSEIIGLFNEIKNYHKGATTNDKYKRVGAYVSTKNLSEKRIEERYLVESSSGKYYVTLTRLEKDGKTGLCAFNVTSEEDSKASGTTVMTSGVNIASLISGLITIIVVIITIIDIIRKDPDKKLLWIICALVPFTLRLSSNASVLLSVTIPLGSIIYWVLRSKLSKNKNSGNGNDRSEDNNDRITEPVYDLTDPEEQTKQNDQSENNNDNTVS